MIKSKMANRYSPEVRARAVWVVFEHQGSYETQAGAIAAIAPRIGCIVQTLNGWVKQVEKDRGGSGSRRWNVRFANCARPMRSCAKRRHILRPLSCV
jgi:transposase